MYGYEQLLYAHMNDVMSAEMISNLVHSFESNYRESLCAKYSEEV